MRIQVRLFAILRDKAQTDAFELELPDGTTITQAIESIGRLHPNIISYLPRTAAAVNREYVRGDHVLRNGDDLALIPPVSGG